MKSSCGYRISLGFYWLALGVWLGAMVMLGIAAGTTFKTVQEWRPTLGVAPYSEMRDPEQPGERYPFPVRTIAGDVVRNVIIKLGRLQAACALVLAACVLLQCTGFKQYLARGKVGSPANICRLALLGGAVLIVAVHMTVTAPRAERLLGEMRDTAGTPAQRAASAVEFRRVHVRSEIMGGVEMLLLAAAVFVTPFALRAGEAEAKIAPEA